MIHCRGRRRGRVAAAPGSAVPSTEALARGMEADQIRMMAEERIVVDADYNITTLSYTYAFQRRNRRVRCPG